MDDLGAALEFVRSFNERDLDAFAAVVAEDVEIHSMKGLRTGREDARAWATRAPGGVQQRILVIGQRHRPGRVLLEIDRHWVWDEDGSPAGMDEMAWLFEVRDGLVASWRPFEDRAEAEEAYAAPA